MSSSECCISIAVAARAAAASPALIASITARCLANERGQWSLEAAMLKFYRSATSSICATDQMNSFPVVV